MKTIESLGIRRDYKKMASSKEYLDFILEQVSELDNVSYKAMMGEFIIYYNTETSKFTLIETGLNQP